MTRYNYNSQILPPAPFVFVSLRQPLTGDQHDNLPAQIDSAADRTLLPLSIAQKLNLPIIGSIPIGGVGGAVQNMNLYAVEIGIQGHPQFLREVVAHPDELWILLGRDVLNEYRVTLDGPTTTLEVH